MAAINTPLSTISQSEAPEPIFPYQQQTAEQLEPRQHHSGCSHSRPGQKPVVVDLLCKSRRIGNLTQRGIDEDHS